MTICSRLKLLRKENLKLTQAKFGEKIGFKATAIGQMESGDRNVTDRTILLICKEYHVNEEWLRNGTGDIFIESDSFSLDEYIKSKGATQLELDLIKSYFEIPEDLRNSLMNHFKNNILKQMNNTEEAATIESTSVNNIDYEVESYRKELEAEQKGQILSASEKPKGA